MNSKSAKKDELEVSSGQLQAELIEIKERVGALETIASISNRDVVERFVREHITTDKARQILKECEEPRTRDHLISKFSFASAQALDHHSIRYERPTSSGNISMRDGSKRLSGALWLDAFPERH
jgi:hypothetical protein